MPKYGVAYRMRIEVEVEMAGNFLIGIAIGVVAAILGMGFGTWIVGRVKRREIGRKIRQMRDAQR